MRAPVLDTTKKPLAPTTPHRARLLLKSGKAAVFKRYPFTIILKREIENPMTPDLRVKIDPGSKTTGVAVVNQETGEIVFAAEIHHRGPQVKASLDSRRALRRGRRQRRWGMVRVRCVEPTSMVFREFIERETQASWDSRPATLCKPIFRRGSSRAVMSADCRLYDNDRLSD
jgi:hypothetical protein